jgi:hypothetical protein
MGRGRGLIVLLAALALLVAMVAPVTAGPPAQAESDTAAEHRRIVEYWTPQRIASAVPRDVAPDPRHHRPDHARGGGNGGGDTEPDPEPDTITTVLGATWTGGGDVAWTSGKVLFTLKGTRYQCSGGAVTDGRTTETVSLVVTAGHCVHEGGGTAFATNWIFYPAWDGSGSPLGPWTATSLFTTPRWADNRSFDDDAGFAVVTNGTTTTLAAALGTRGAAPQQVSFAAPLLDEGYFAFGYPAAQKYSGNTLTYCAGPVRTDRDRHETLSMGCDMTGGSSGGPWFHTFDQGEGAGVVNSVNSYGYRNLKDVMFGPVFDGPEQTTYEAAVTATCPADPSGYRCD